MKQAIPFQTRVITALANHERLLQQVAQMKKQIGAHLADCPAMKKANDPDTIGDDYYALIDQKGLVKTHLWEAFNNTVESDYGNQVLMSYDDQEIHLTEEDTGCEHCYAAWRVIQYRKDVRQELGRARRALRMLGKSALKVAP
ncbi:hypothetical protein HZF02_18055 [Pseudomonas yamanorum]|nr:hypothetical protein HZF02_18055 [Pseudomonas yamanorum]